MGSSHSVTPLVRAPRPFLEPNPKRAFAENDPIALDLATEFPGVRMPSLGIGKVDAEDLLSYLDGESARIVDAPLANAPPHAGHHHHEH